MKNVIELIVVQEYERLLPAVSDFCGCDLCREDVLVYALNRLTPQYVTQPTGEILTGVAMQGDQAHADVAVVLLDGFRRVRANPRPGHESRK
ncbi:MAG: hypothetical protein GTN62_07960 [Gemmatimonadales bacterium]|nr:hypothetical protein [Gemmatimonadales bacterium]NIN50035.1 hypothetical protein [Gemmatimonadales bacterium]NIP07499.1 hypothetical protein [Gemmatimonadales bacterium]NIR03138.1 hypothetical protein [Gemmatimonadales bacterium]NIS66850.1 hypothetical protein [Gemmatimonadales bacterium]